MAFIPIIAKADVEQSKKGKISPAQMAQAFAFMLQNKTGIFNITGRRCEATASTPANNKSTITFAAGYIAICGRLVEVEQGTTLEIDTPASGSVNGYIIAKFDLASVEENEFTVEAVPSSHTLVQQDLNNNTVGTYELVIYSYTATSSNVTLTRSDSIYFDSDKIVFEDIYGAISTINTRLTNLGFRTGSASGNNVSATLYRQGNYVIAHISINSSFYSDTSPLITGGTLLSLPQFFRPKVDTYMYLGGKGEYRYNQNIYRNVNCGFDLTIYANGNVYISAPKGTMPVGAGTSTPTEYSVCLQKFDIYAGFEADPIT